MTQVNPFNKPSGNVSAGQNPEDGDICGSDGAWGGHCLQSADENIVICQEVDPEHNAKEQEKCHMSFQLPVVYINTILNNPYPENVCEL